MHKLCDIGRFHFFINLKECDFGNGKDNKDNGDFHLWINQLASDYIAKQLEITMAKPGNYFIELTIKE